MEDIKNIARAAKQRLKSNFWDECKKNVEAGTTLAVQRGFNERKVKSTLCAKVKDHIKGEKSDEFYLKVKTLLDTEGEVSDAIYRLTDREYFDSLSYEEKQRYTLRLSAQYLQALEKYRREKELGF